MSQKAFECRRCGQCCQGRGGIVLTAEDIERLAGHLGVSESEFLRDFVETQNHKPGLRSADDGYCVFYEPDLGCGVHPARPDICRAWPFFRGNLLDPESWRMAQEYCPGINPEVEHQEFARQGALLLRELGLARGPGRCAPNALVWDQAVKP
ncbi:MAG: YkgJ family cysteine cluster protein [Desulfovibrionaceae bacterium]|nr:YkgJ family cysteine cluster protein [Desulfovibrionaceae bacterium]